ncbi:MAG: SDR family NAD(P)-dependent oxidoreductase [Candidatus Firestonebacteria bacterium]
MKNKIALITGSTRGIGKATALRFVNEGISVVINGRNEESIMTVVKEIKDKGGKATGKKVDISKIDEVQKMVKEIIEEFGYIDILVNNAGIYEIVPLLEITEEKWDKMMNVNLKGTFNCIKTVLPFMIKQKSGRIINITSIAGKTGSMLPLAHYAASKAGIISLTKSVAREFASYGITVNAVCPGVIDTEMTADIIEGKRNQIPLGDAGKPEDVANAVFFLSSEQSKYITGEILDVNGGLLMD